MIRNNVVGFLNCKSSSVALAKFTNDMSSLAMPSSMNVTVSAVSSDDRSTVNVLTEVVTNEAGVTAGSKPVNVIVLPSKSSVPFESLPSFVPPASVGAGVYVNVVAVPPITSNASSPASPPNVRPPDGNGSPPLSHRQLIRQRLAIDRQGGQVGDRCVQDQQRRSPITRLNP